MAMPQGACLQAHTMRCTCHACLRTCSCLCQHSTPNSLTAQLMAVLLSFCQLEQLCWSVGQVIIESHQPG